MNPDHIYETETMAELCARQGRVSEAIDIYRRLRDSLEHGPPRTRVERRLDTLESAWQPPSPADVQPADMELPAAPGVAVLVGDDQVTVAWALPLGTVTPVVDLLLLQRTPTGIETVKQTLSLEAPTGRLAVAAPSVHSAVAAVGPVVGGRFVPLARSRR
jgi:pentatricopeptide repeat protein